MSLELVVVILLGAAAGGFISGLAGFGTALLSLGIWLHVMPPWQAVAIIAAMSVVSGVQGLWLIRHEISGTHRLPRFLVPALLGLPIGIAVLQLISASVLKTVIAGFMILYGVFFAFRRALPHLQHSMPKVDALVGFSGGVLGGAAALSGALPTMWCAMQPWTKGETSAVLRPYSVVILAIATAVFIWQGYYTQETLIYMLIALPATLASSHVGVVVFRRLSDNQFRRLLIWLLFTAGSALAFRELSQVF